MSLKEAERPGSGRYRDGCCSEQMMRGRVSSTGNAGLVDYYRFASEMSVRHQYQRRDMRVSTLTRSEERRVGKECRSRWWRDYYRKAREKEDENKEEMLNRM